MAVLKRLTTIQAARIAAAKRVKPVDVKLTANEQARRDAMIAEAKVNYVKATGKPLKAQRWYQPDYRSATPKGLVLISDRVRGVQPRFGVK